MNQCITEGLNQDEIKKQKIEKSSNPLEKEEPGKKVDESFQNPEELLWHQAVKENTHSSYVHYLQESKLRKYVEQAQEALSKLGQDYGGDDDVEWFQASSTNTVESYRDFLINYPMSKFAEEAKSRYKNLKKAF